MSSIKDLPYFVLRIINNQDIPESEIDRFVIEFYNDYAINPEFRLNVEGKHILFFNGEYKGIIETEEIENL